MTRSEQPVRARVLLVDDEPLVRRVTTSILEAEGYQVRAFGCGLVALAEMELQLADVDIVVTDVVMPTITGSNFVVRLRAAGYAGPVLYVSGYTAHASLDDDGGDSLLTKPFKARELYAAIERLLLDRATPSP